jgi:signal transduction histidine kinase
MNHNVERSPNAAAGGAPWTRDAAPLTTGRNQRWFRRPNRERLNRELNLRLEERHSERTRIARELHDTLLQGFLGASLVLHDAVEGMPADSPSKPSLTRALHLMRRVIDEGRVALQGLRSPGSASTSLEQALSEFADEFAHGGAQFRIFVMGRPKVLPPAIQEQIYLIVQEALGNALRHSGATSIEAEVEYLPNKLRVVVRDNGSGIDTQVLRSGRDLHWGLLGMRERAGTVGAQLRIWSRPGAGTEVEISVPIQIVADAHAHQSSANNKPGISVSGKMVGLLSRQHARERRENVV